MIYRLVFFQNASSQLYSTLSVIKRYSQAYQMVYQNTPVTRWGSTKIAIIMETILLTLSIPMIALAAISGVQLGHAYLYHVGPDRLMNIGGVGPETHLVPIPDLSVP